MKLKIAPVVWVGLLALCCLNAWLLTVILGQLAPPAATPPAPSNRAGTHVEPTTNSVVQKPLDAYTKTLAQPVFFRNRSPYVPPPPSTLPTAQMAPPPPVNPNLSVAGVIIDRQLKKAYLLKQGEPHGVWVAEGEDVLGWTLQSVGSTGVTLKQGGRTIELDLYLK